MRHVCANPERVQRSHLLSRWQVQNKTFHAEDIPLLATVLKFFMFLVFGLGVAIVGMVTVAQMNGAFCKELIVSTGSDNYPGLSGLYKFSGKLSQDRPVYDQVHPSGYEFDKKYKLLYCGSSQAWTIVRMTPAQNPQEACQSQWLISSKETEGFSVFEPDSWMEWSRSTALTSSDLIVKCNQCEKV